jgi:nitrogen fixation/metabolism regulation signal transduction histidine kinase
MKIANKLTALFIIIPFISVLSISMFAFTTAEREENTKVGNQLINILDLQEQHLSKMIEDAKEGGNNYLSTLVSLRLSLIDYLSSGNKKSLSDVTNALDIVKNNDKGIKRISIVSADGNVIASTDDKSINKAFFNKKLIDDAARSDQVSVLNDNDGQASLFLANGIYANGKSYGIIVIERNTNELFTIVKDYYGLGKTGETAILQANADGTYSYIAPLRFDENATLTRIVKKGELNDKVLSGSPTYIDGVVDYRGNIVSAAAKTLDLTKWRIIVKIDRSESFSDIAALGNILLFIFAAVIIVNVLLALYFARVITIPIVVLTNAAQKISSDDFSIDFPDIQEKDEIGMLTSAFKKMSGKIFDYKKSAREYNLSLEKKVEERTNELNKKLADIERMNNFMIGRELKMIELKKTIRDLSDKLDVKTENIDDV